MKLVARLTLHVCLFTAACFAAAPVPEAANPGEELARMADVSGHYGGRLTLGQRNEPKHLNPVTATGAGPRDVMGRLTGRLIEINRRTRHIQPERARAWKI